MKKLVKVLLVLLCILTALGTLASCSVSDILGGLGIGGETEWKPTGKEVTLLKKNIPGDYIIVHGGSDESASAAATNLKDILTEEGAFEVYTEPSEFAAVCEALSAKGYKFLSADLEKVPASYVELSEEQAVQMQKMLDMLEENDDVQNVFHNWDE